MTARPTKKDARSQVADRLVKATAMALATVTAAALSLGLTSCKTAFVATRPHPAPQGEAVLAFLRQRQAAIVGVDLETRTTSWINGERTRASVYMLVDRAGRLRFEAEVALQGTVATLITDGKTFALTDFQAHLAKTGAACPENIAALIPVPLLPAEIAPILLGDAPVGPSARVTGITWDGTAAADIVQIEQAGTGPVLERMAIGVRPEANGRFRIVSVQGETPSGGGVWQVAFAEFVEAAGFAHPGLIRFAEPGRSFDDGVEIKVKSRKINPAFRLNVFAPTPPDGFPVQSTPCPR